MLRRTLPALLLIPMLAAVAPQWADACSCAPPPPPKKALEGSAAVFTGKVTAIERKDRQYVVVTFDVDRSWKGPNTKSITVRTPPDSAACGVNFEAKKEYIVYCHARTDAAGGVPKLLETNLCTRTSLLANAKRDVETLGEGRVPTEEGAEAPAGGREVKVVLTVPSTAHRICIREVHRVGDALWVLSEVRIEGIGGAAISKTEATAKVVAPAELPLKHFVLGKDWNWSMEKYEYPANKQAFDELAEQSEGKKLATFECFAKPEPKPLGPPPEEPRADPRPQPDPARRGA